jgi:hypothetical protein
VDDNPGSSTYTGYSPSSSDRREWARRNYKAAQRRSRGQDRASRPTAWTSAATGTDTPVLIRPWSVMTAHQFVFLLTSYNRPRRAPSVCLQFVDGAGAIGYGDHSLTSDWYGS